MMLRKIGYAAVIAMTAAAFVIGSAVLSDAKAKKKAAAAPPPALPCMNDGGPVCATKGGMKFTYANSCYAAKDGAAVSSNKACPAKKAMKAGGKKKAAKKMAKPDKKK